MAEERFSFGLIVDDDQLGRLQGYAARLSDSASVGGVIVGALVWAAETGLDVGPSVASDHPLRLRRAQHTGVNRYTIYVSLPASAMRWLVEQAFRHHATRQAVAWAAVEAWAGAGGLGG